MVPLQQNIHAVIRPGEESGYVAECLEIAVVTQGMTLDKTSKRLYEEVYCRVKVCIDPPQSPLKRGKPDSNPPF